MNLLYLFGSYGAISLEDFEKSIPEIGIHSGFGDEWLKIGGIKLFADGIPQTKTAWLHEDYPDGGNGSLVLPGATDEERCEELVQMIGFAHRHGFQCAIHAIGDRAIEACVDGFVRAERGRSARPAPLSGPLRPHHRRPTSSGSSTTGSGSAPSPSSSGCSPTPSTRPWAWSGRSGSSRCGLCSTPACT